MAIYDSCSPCRGIGSDKCTECSCSICGGSRNTKNECPRCYGKGTLACGACAGNGLVLKKKSLFFGDTYQNCGHCGGRRETRCDFCKGIGTVQVSCLTCKGTGADGRCLSCKGRGSITCAECGGAGKVLPNWSRERIRDEIERRKDSIAELQEAIEYHYEQYELRPQDGFQGRGLETHLSELRDEINQLRDMLH
jgi:hypothetical protein